MLFHALTFAGSQGRCLNTMHLGQVIKHRPSDLASVNAMKQKCVIVILAYSTGFQPKLRYITFLTLDFSKQNGVRVKLSNVIWPELHRRVKRFHEQKHLGNDQSKPQCYPMYHHANNSGLTLSFVKFNTMCKQHVYLMI